jgi:hypothetical protein
LEARGLNLDNYKLDKNALGEYILSSKNEDGVYEESGKVPLEDIKDILMLDKVGKFDETTSSEINAISSIGDKLIEFGLDRFTTDEIEKDIASGEKVDLSLLTEE